MGTARRIPRSHPRLVASYPQSVPCGRRAHNGSAKLNRVNAATGPELARLFELLQTRHHLAAAGVSDRTINTRLRRGELTRIWRGCYVNTGAWASRTAVDQHLLRAMGAAQLARHPPVFSHLTAAAALGLPLMRFDSSKVHALILPERGNGRRGQLVHHRHPFTDEDLITIGPLTCTTLGRTIVDLARGASVEQGVVAGDAGLLRLVGGRGDPEHCRAELLGLLGALPRGRGHRHAARVIGFFDAGSESALESLYRLQFARLGFAVRTQVAVPSPNGGNYRLDFELEGHGVFFEADGKEKYTAERFRNGRGLDEILLAEKRREDWIRGTTDKRLVRGGWNDALSPGATARLLRSYGITVPGDPRHVAGPR